MPVKLMNADLCEEGSLCVPLRELNPKRKKGDKDPIHDLEWEGRPSTLRTTLLPLQVPLTCVHSFIARSAHGQC